MPSSLLQVVKVGFKKQHYKSRHVSGPKSVLTTCVPYSISVIIVLDADALVCIHSNQNIVDHNGIGS